MDVDDVEQRERPRARRRRQRHRRRPHRHRPEDGQRRPRRLRRRPATAPPTPSSLNGSDKAERVHVDRAGAQVLTTGLAAQTHDRRAASPRSTCCASTRSAVDDDVQVAPDVEHAHHAGRRPRRRPVGGIEGAAARPAAAPPSGAGREWRAVRQCRYVHRPGLRASSPWRGTPSARHRTPAAGGERPRGAAHRARARARGAGSGGDAAGRRRGRHRRPGGARRARQDRAPRARGAERGPGRLPRAPRRARSAGAPFRLRGGARAAGGSAARGVRRAPGASARRRGGPGRRPAARRGGTRRGRHDGDRPQRAVAVLGPGRRGAAHARGRRRALGRPAVARGARLPGPADHRAAAAHRHRGPCRRSRRGRGPAQPHRRGARGDGAAPTAADPRRRGPAHPPRGALGPARASAASAIARRPATRGCWASSAARSPTTAPARSTPPGAAPRRSAPSRARSSARAWPSCRPATAPSPRRSP